MKRRNFLAGLSALLVSSCAYEEARQARYEPNKCPVCLTEPGVCSYCHGKTKCTFCGGSGRRKTTTASMPGEHIKSVTYEEECPYCHGNGVCRYCEGSGKCWVCNGTGHVENWDFLNGPKKDG